MTSTLPPRARPGDDTGRRSKQLALVSAVVTGLVYLSAWVVPRGDALFQIPVWVTPTACVLTVAVAALTLRRDADPRVVTWLGGAAVIGMVWSAGGVLLDVVPTLALFGLVDLPVTPDLPLMATRLCSLVTAVLLVRALIRDHRETRRLCLRCGQGGQPVRQRLWLGYAGVVFGLPYPILKTHWALGGTVGLDYSDLARDGFTRGWMVAPVALVGLVLSLALVHRWGRVWPRWVPGLAGRRTPRGLLLFGGWFGSAVLLTMGAAAVPGMVTDLLGGTPMPAVDGMHAWPGMMFYTSWLLWGLVLAPATWLYQARTRPQCATCGQAPG